MTCKRIENCYLPKDMKKFTIEQTNKYIDSCRNYGIGCEIEKLSDIEFKLFERDK